MVASVLVAALYKTGFVHAPLMVAIALTTTAIGTLLPILRDAGELATPFGRFILAAGAIGELGPIMLMSLVLTQDQNRWTQTGFMLAFVALSGLAIGVALRVRTPRALAFLARRMHASSQLPVRICILLLVGLVTLAESFGLDVILGAFAAGLIVTLVNRTQREREETLRHKLDAIGFGFLVPIFFVTSGLKFDASLLFESWNAALKLPLFLALFLVVRGAPALLYRRDLPREDLLPLALYSSTALPLVVAITELGVATGRMLPENSAALVGAAMLSVLVFPLVALAFRSSRIQAPRRRHRPVHRP